MATQWSLDASWISVILACLAWKWVLLPLFSSPLKRVPGPKLSLVTSIVLQRHAFAGERMYYIHELHRRYGPIVRIAPNEVSIMGQSTFTTIYGHGSKFRKSAAFYGADHIEDWPNGVANISDVREHARRRKIVAPAFSIGNINRLEPYVISKAQILAQQFEKSPKEVDVAKWFRTYTSEVAIMFAFGEDARMVDSAGHQTLTDDLDNIMVLFVTGALSPSLFRIIRRATPASLQRLRHILDAIPRMINFADNVIGKYSAKPDGEGSKELLHQLVNAHHNNILTRAQVGSELNNMLIAGTDTTATALTYLCWRLAARPEAQARVRGEVTASVPDRGQMLPLETLEKLSYLSWVIRETLRLHAGVQTGLPREVPEGGMVMGPHFLPKGTVVSAQAYDSHRDPTVWGQDAEIWRPERWASITKDQEAAMQPFSSGPTGCLGAPIAYMELYIVTARLFNLFDVKLAPSCSEEGMKMVDFFTIYPKCRSCKLVFTPLSA